MIPGAEVCLCPECPDVSPTQLSHVVVGAMGTLIGTLRHPSYVGRCIVKREEIVTLTETQGAYETQSKKEAASEDDEVPFG